MPKLPGGKGWAFIPGDDPKPPQKINPQSPVAKIRLEKRAGGKYVTVISGLHTFGADRLEAIARELKSSSGAGGTVKDGTIQIQGNKVRECESYFAKVRGK